MRTRGAQESTILLPQFLVLGLQFLVRGGFWCVTQGLIKNTVVPFSKWGIVPISIWQKFHGGSGGTVVGRGGGGGGGGGGGCGESLPCFDLV